MMSKTFTKKNANFADATPISVELLKKEASKKQFPKQFIASNVGVIITKSAKQGNYEVTFTQEDFLMMCKVFDESYTVFPKYLAKHGYEVDDNKCSIKWHNPKEAVEVDDFMFDLPSIPSAKKAFDMAEIVNSYAYDKIISAIKKTLEKDLSAASEIVSLDNKLNNCVISKLEAGGFKLKQVTFFNNTYEIAW